MGYVAIQGGERALAEAARALDFVRAEGESEPIDLRTIRAQFAPLVSRVLSEGAVHAPELAALALKQTGGDTLEAAFHLRAWRATRPRLTDTPPLHAAGSLRPIRRISAAFKDVPGGQHLGPTRDFGQRLLRFELLDEDPEAFRAAARSWLEGVVPDADLPDFPSVLERLRAEGLLPPSPPAGRPQDAPFDVTRQPIVCPVLRSAALQQLARGEQGAVLAFAYTLMRGYGDIHPTVAELRVGYLPVELPHPLTGEPVEAGEVLVTECEVVAMYERLGDDDDAAPTFGLGYGCCFGHNETKAIAAAILDRSLQLGREGGARMPAQDEEFVLLHVDGIDSMGFCNHYKMPHYVTFQSDLDRLRTTRARWPEGPGRARDAEGGERADGGGAER